MFSIEQWQKELNIQESCGHSMFGSCLMECPQCKVYGFYGIYEDGGRKYRMCKWCLWFQNVGEESCRVYYEVCPKCFGDGNKVKPDLKSDGVPKLSTEEGIRITQFPGHPCPKCGTTMKEHEWKENPLESFRKEIYEIHQYEF